jgi:hypothetical protein
MNHNKSKQDNRDRSRVAIDEDYEVDYLAERAGLTVAQARELIRKHGNDRETLMREAQRLK